MMDLPILLIVALMQLSTTWANATPVLSASPVSNHYMDYSHVFHDEPHTLMNSILSDVSQAEISTDPDGKNVFHVDVSSSQLDDTAIVSLMTGLISLLREKVQSVYSSSDLSSRKHGRVLLNLALGMNLLTPLGASKLFDILIDAETDIKTSMNKTLSDPSARCNSLEINHSMIEHNHHLITDEIANQPLILKDEILNMSPSSKPIIEIQELDLSFSDVGGHGTHTSNLLLLNSVRSLFESRSSYDTSSPESRIHMLIPRVLKMENCGIGPAFCRCIGRGMLNAFERGRTFRDSRPSTLSLAGNPAIGDAGVVALAAALRLGANRVEDEIAMADFDDDERSIGQHILDDLDLSSCNVGDTGAEALALALAFNPDCISRLDLSNNRISDLGAKALSQALIEAQRIKVARGDKMPFVLKEIVLDNNVQLGDEGAAALAKAMSFGAVKIIRLRSCSVRAEGISAFGRAISSMARGKGNQLYLEGKTRFQIDLSGNHFGILASKTKGTTYSASRLREKASSHLNSIGKTIQSRLKGARMSMGITIDSDTDDDNLMGGLIDREDTDGEKLLETITRCGARSFCGEILRCDDADQNESKRLETTVPFRVTLGMRQCYLDDGAIDALSASIVEMKKLDVALTIDVRMNSLHYSKMDALLGQNNQEELLNSMAERYLSALEVLNQAHDRASFASEVSLGRTFFDIDSDTETDPYNFD